MYIYIRLCVCVIVCEMKTQQQNLEDKRAEHIMTYRMCVLSLHYRSRHCPSCGFLARLSQSSKRISSVGWLVFSFSFHS